MLHDLPEAHTFDSSRTNHSEQNFQRWATICTDVSALLQASAPKQRSACASEPHIQRTTPDSGLKGSGAETVVSKRIGRDVHTTFAIVFTDGWPPDPASLPCQIPT